MQFNTRKSQTFAAQAVHLEPNDIPTVEILSLANAPTAAEMAAVKKT